MKITKAIIPAAGLGTRLLPATKAQPKEMLPIVDKPTLQYIIEEAIESGIEEVLIITGRNKTAIENHFDKSIELELELEKKGKIQLLEEIRKISNIINIHYIRQKEQKGLGSAIYCAKSFVGNEPFAVLLGDDIVKGKSPCLKQIMDTYNTHKSTILGVQIIPKKDVVKYGIVKGELINENTHRVLDLIEKPSIEAAPSNIAIIGRYIITPEIFKIIEETPPGKGGEIQLTDALKVLAKKEPMYAYIFEGKRFDIGNKMGFLKANIEIALMREDLKDEFYNYLLSITKSDD